MTRSRPLLFRRACSRRRSGRARRTVRSPRAPRTRRARPGRTRRRGARRGAATSSRGCPEELVPDAPHGPDQLGIVGAVAELLADAADVHVDDALVAEEVEAPDLLEELAAGEDSPRRTCEGDAGGRTRARSARRQTLCARPHVGPTSMTRPSNTSRSPLSAARCATAAPEHRLDPGDELPRAERLRDVVVRADREPDELVDLLGPGRQQDHRDLRRRRGACAGPRCRRSPASSRRARRDRVPTRARPRGRLRHRTPRQPRSRPTRGSRARSRESEPRRRPRGRACPHRLSVRRRVPDPFVLHRGFTELRRRAFTAPALSVCTNTRPRTHAPRPGEGSDRCRDAPPSPPRARSRSASSRPSSPSAPTWERSDSPVPPSTPAPQAPTAQVAAPAAQPAPSAPSTHEGERRARPYLCRHARSADRPDGPERPDAPRPEDTSTMTDPTNDHRPGRTDSAAPGAPRGVRSSAT